ncbi:hypothetical protein [Pandoraea fibrosis]|uniref:Uncharacterized protein n=1 Tax=Pandoraea fibrosis TaxID=1891094 RepID=A0A5E4XK89_9BURK|nr:hypothetical protein [Pandoraea fibrosis]VVE36899.1 hypothetical protein PFI31113_03914 [Pandoraea fibrosis]
MYAVDYEGHAISVLVELANKIKHPNGFDVSIVITADGEVVDRLRRTVDYEAPQPSAVALDWGLQLARRRIDTGNWD